VGETLAETRVEIEARRTELERTAAQLRDSLDIRKRFQENPALFIGVGAGAIFLLVGGPGRVAGVVRRRFFPTNPEKAYDSLPKPMQAWVDHMAGALGPRAGDARQALSEELALWRNNPRKHGKISKKLAKQIAEGPPGPQRAAWSAFEAGAAIITAALARKAVERFLSGEPPSGVAPLDAAGTVGGAAEPDPKHAKDDVTKRKATRAEAAKAEKAEYSGMSSRVP
jgi:hypothetical protein